MGPLVFSIVLVMVALFILYIVISTAVKDGINKSVVGQFLEKENGVIEKKKTFLDNDLDNS